MMNTDVDLINLTNLLKSKLVDIKLLFACRNVDMYNSAYRARHYCKNRNEGKLFEAEFTYLKGWLEE